jgi:hypothetical protein
MGAGVDHGGRRKRWIGRTEERGDETTGQILNFGCLTPSLPHCTAPEEHLECGPFPWPHCGGAGVKGSAAYQELHSSPLFQRIGVQRFALLGNAGSNEEAPGT